MKKRSERLLLRWRSVGVVLPVLLVAPSWMCAQEPVRTPGHVAAYVDGVQIYDFEVEQVVRQGVGERPIDPAMQPRLMATALNELVDQQLVLKYLKRKGLHASEQDVQHALATEEERLKQKGADLEQFLKQANLDQDGYRRQLTWRLSWRRFTDKMISDANLARYFAQHATEFDGTQLRVAQILWPPPPLDDAGKWDALVAEAKAVREEIVNRRLDFSEAVRRHSKSPSAKKDGQLGWIERDGPMPESFSRAAFQLKSGEISHPVVSSFGVHLIKCIEVKSGRKTWQDARGELQRAASLHLFEWAANRERPAARIRLTGVVPHFREGTDELVVPKTE
jgi:parvulin-like peptidyl-prolyl isomerase